MGEKIPVGKCADCGYVYGDDLEYLFPEPSECSCGRTIENTTVADATTVKALSDSKQRYSAGVSE